MKILLINPSFYLGEAGAEEKSFEKVVNVIPPLGLLYLAAVSEQKNHVVKIIDCSLGFGYSVILEEAKKFQPRIIGITATTPVFQYATHIAVLLRKALPEVVFVCGGAHPTSSPQDAGEKGVFDYLVLGEGENTFIELISYLEGKVTLSLQDIKGIAFRENGKLIINPQRQRIDDLDSIPLPARHLVPSLDVYSPTPASYRRLPLAVIIT